DEPVPGRHQGPGREHGGGREPEPERPRARPVPARRARRPRHRPAEPGAHERPRHEHGHLGGRGRVRAPDAALPLPPGLRRSVDRGHAADRRRLRPHREPGRAEGEVRGGAPAMTQRFDAETVTEAMASPRWSALVRTGLDLSAVATWDPAVVRESRVLAPAEAPAPCVPRPPTETWGPSPPAPPPPGGRPPVPPPPVLDPGAPRPAGGPLRWAPPDAPLRGTMPAASANPLQLPPLP